MSNINVNQNTRNNVVSSFESIPNTQYYNLPLNVSRHAYMLLWGQGYSVRISKDNTTDDTMTEKVEELLEKAGFDYFSTRQESKMSIHGYAMATIIRRDNGDIRFGENNPLFTSKMSQITFVDDVSAWIWSKFVWDDVNYTLIEKWDKEKVVRILSTNLGITIINGFNSKVPEEMRIKEVERHNYGILPVHLFKNLDEYVPTPSQLPELADDFAVRNLPQAINRAYQKKLQEIELDSTRVYGHFSPQQIKQLKKKGVSFNESLMANLFWTVKSRGEGGNNELVEVAQANLTQLIPLDESITKDIKRYWEGCGYTYMSGEESINTNASTLFAKGKDIQTTKFKREYRQRQYAEFIKKVMVVNNLISADEMVDYDVAFTIKENLVQSPEQIVEQEARMIELKLQTKAQALARIRDMDAPQAEAQIKEAQEEADAQDARDAKLLNAPEDPAQGSAKTNETPNQPKVNTPAMN